MSRYETTGIRPEYLRDATPLNQVQRKIQDFLCNGEPVWKIRSRGGKARILVGHGLDHDLDCLKMEYPAIMIRYGPHVTEALILNVCNAHRSSDQTWCQK